MIHKNIVRKCSEFANKSYKDDEILGEESCFISDQNTDTQLYISKENSNIYIICRGTSSSQDAIQDIKIWRKKCSFLNNTLVHSGFLEQYESIRNKLIETINDYLDSSTKHIICTGHSLGSSLCTIAALDLQLKYADKDVKCITFASPRVGNTSFAKLFNETIKDSCRFVYHRDPVTFLPFALRFKHVKGCIHLKKDGSVNISDKYFYPFGCFISQHFMDAYQNRINDWLDNEDFFSLVI